MVFTFAAPQQAQRGLVGRSERVDRTSLRVVCRMYRAARIAQCADGSVKRIARLPKRAERLVVPSEDWSVLGLRDDVEQTRGLQDDIHELDAASPVE